MSVSQGISHTIYLSIYLSIYLVCIVYLSLLPFSLLLPTESKALVTTARYSRTCSNRDWRRKLIDTEDGII